jgi:hypothetical protein
MNRVQFTALAMSLGCVLSVAACGSNSSSPAPSAPLAPALLPNTQIAQLGQPSKITCTTINFLRGGLENAGGTKEYVISLNDIHQEHIVSENSLNRIVLRSHQGRIALEVLNVKFGVDQIYSRGEVDFPIDTTAVTLYPNNSIMGNDGFSWAHCETKLKTIPQTNAFAKWACSYRGYEKTPFVPKEILISSQDRNNESVLTDSNDFSLIVTGHRGTINLGQKAKRPGFRADPRAISDLSSSATTDGINNGALLFYPRGSVDGRKISCHQMAASGAGSNFIK